MKPIDTLTEVELKSKLHRAKEIIGAHIADMKEGEIQFFKELTELFQELYHKQPDGSHEVEAICGTKWHPGFSYAGYWKDVTCKKCLKLKKSSRS